jgi:iron complex outermembrane recepter protein
MKNKLLTHAIAYAVTCISAGFAWGAPDVSEQDFLNEMPIVLSVSRLAQRLDETPGAVTILDRQFIRTSGARDVVDLLRLVPGFQTTTSFETDAPLATYHGRSDDAANRIQVLVDGRSVYSGHLLGSAGLGWQVLALEDIERIEVLRGSNSAAYGARAFLGVVNIISRDTRDTLGMSASATAGQNNVRDARFRMGWGGTDAYYRLSADVRGDDGLQGAYGSNQIQRFNFSSLFDIGPHHELHVRFGAVDIDAGRGSPGDAGNNARIRKMGSRFAQLDWHKTLDENRDLSIAASHTEHQFKDSFPLETTAYDEFFGHPYNGILLDFGGNEINDALAVQYTERKSPNVRYVAGAEFRRETVFSRSSFDERADISTQFWRVFGNLEWRVSPDWILNAGAMAENISNVGDIVSPRLMMNWNAAPGHTLRAGVSTASRPPSAYERYTDVKYYDRNGQNPLVWRIHDGNLKPERVVVRELGYFTQWPSYAFTGDVRLFQESIIDGISNNRSDPPADPEIFKNTEASTIEGLEYQLKFQPMAGTQVLWSQTWTHIRVTASRDPGPLTTRTEGGAAPRAISLAVTQQLAPGWDASLGFQQADGISLLSTNNGARFLQQRTDVRLAKSFRWAGHPAELAVTVQNLGSPQRDGDRTFYFERRAMLTFSIAQ